MDDILASIRKILNEDDPSATTQPPRPAASPEVLQLTPEMMVTPPESLAGPPPAPAPAPPPAPMRVPTNIMQPLPAAQPAMPEPAPMPAEALVDPLAAAAAAAALGQLSRAVAQERSATVSRGGPSIEDVVREELRPMLKAWLDAHLPATVERLVRSEIERVMARQG
jgi:cell pole-organizing protein PopZ